MASTTESTDDIFEFKYNISREFLRELGLGDNYHDFAKARGEWTEMALH